MSNGFDFMRLVERSPLGIHAVDSTGLTTFVNPAFLRMFGIPSADAVVGTLNVLNDEIIESRGLRPYVDRVFRGEIVRTPTVLSPTPGGPLRKISATLVPVMDNAGQLEAIVSFSEDETDTLASGEVLADRYDHSVSLLEAFQRIAEERDPARVQDLILDGLAAVWPDPSAIWLGTPGTESWHCAAWRGLSESYVRGTEENYRTAPVENTVGGKALLSNAPVVIEDIHSHPYTQRLGDLARRDGVQSVVAIPLRDRSGFCGLLALYGRTPGPFDPSALQTALLLAAHASLALHNLQLFAEMEAIHLTLEDRVRERTEDLRAAHAERIASERLAAVGFIAREAAHGLRNPLNVISASNYYIRSRCTGVDERAASHFETINRAVQQAASTINQLMDLAGSRVLECAAMDFNALAQRTLQERCNGENGPCDAQWAAEPLMVMGDWLQLSHAVKALIDNAASAPQRGAVCVRTEASGDSAVLSVGDHRPPPAAQADAPNDPTEATAAQWMGLGLGVARSIARKHGGDVVDSREGDITWFRLSIPLLRPK